MSKTLVATFESRPSAQVAVNKLLERGFSDSDISVLMTDDTRGREFEVESSTKASEGATAGAVAGGALGALAIGLTSVGTIASGGSLLAAGPIVAVLAGAGAGGTAGGLLGGLVGMGIPEHEAKLSSQGVEKGHILVGVESNDDRSESVKDILENSGAYNISV